jgi:hypothetical protein
LPARPADLTQVGVARAAQLIREGALAAALNADACLAALDRPARCSAWRAARNAGILGLTIPAGPGRMTKLPVGISLDGPANTDARVLAIGRAMENVLGATAPPAR